MSNILTSLSKKDIHWREVALKMTGSKHKADDLVQDMYIRMDKYNPEKWNYSYVYLTMWNILKDNYKNINHYSELNNDITEDVTINENSSFNDIDLQILSKINNLSDEDKKIVLLNYDLSTGQIAKGLQQCRIKTYRDLIRIRKIILGNNLKGYKNRRLKWKK